MKNKEFYEQKLTELKANSNFRQVKNIKQSGKYINLDGKWLLNFSSNDYLGISCDTVLREEFLKEFLNSGAKISAPSARLLCGSDTIFNETETLIAKIFNKDRALLFNSGYHGNVGIYSSLLNSDDVVFIDKLNHASIIDGIRLSKAKVIPYKHLDYADLRQKLQKYRKNYKKAIISSESLFSMDGDIADINNLADLKEEFDTLLIIDEAHSFGVYGDGTGLSKMQGAIKRVDLILATFGKAIGSYGAFAVGDSVLIDYLVNFARSFIFSTSLPIVSVAFANYVLKNKVLKDNSLQKKLFNLNDTLRNMLKNFDLIGESYIIPIILGENKRAVEFSKRLIQQGFYILPIRYPTVAKNTARLRISLNSALDENDIKELANCLNFLYSE